MKEVIYMEYLSIGKMAKSLGVTEQTLRNWDKLGKLKPAYVAESGYRYYSEEQLAKVKGLFYEESNEKYVVGYCRVSTRKQSENLDRQIECVKQFCIAKGYSFKIITDIGSGINYNNKGLQDLLLAVMNNEVSKIVIMYKDRLVRFGFELIEFICKYHNVEIEIIDLTDKSEQEEFVEDLIQIITIFSARLNGKRANRVKQIITELKEGDNP